MIGVVPVGRRACRLGGCLAHCEQCVRLADQSSSGVAGRVKVWAGDILERGGVDENEVLWILEQQCKLRTYLTYYGGRCGCRCLKQRAWWAPKDPESHFSLNATRVQKATIYKLPLQNVNLAFRRHQQINQEALDEEKGIFHYLSPVWYFE